MDIMLLLSDPALTLLEPDFKFYIEFSMEKPDRVLKGLIAPVECLLQKEGGNFPLARFGGHLFTKNVRILQGKNTC